MSKRELNCRGCGTNIGYRNIYEYSKCKSCNSINYNSDQTATEDNNKYFQEFYKPQKYNESKIRKSTFLLFNFIHDRIFYCNIRKFKKIVEKIEYMICKASTSCEIGFGGGDELIKFLKKGANIVGIDQSTVAVNNFKKKYPDYAQKVYCTNTFNEKVGVIYSNALLEHVDDPKNFLMKHCAQIDEDGYLILRIPMIIENGIDSDKQLPPDINFWKPCHRILFSMKGISEVIQKCGFEIIDFVPLKYYGYKVMNQMLAEGYSEIMEMRNPYFEEVKFNYLQYTFILIKSLFRTTLCTDVAIIANRN